MAKLLKDNKGTTLVEMLVVMAITAVLATIMGRTLSKNNLNFDRIYTSILADVRLVQAMATSGTQYQGSFRCGFGVHYVDQITFTLYAGPIASSVDCNTDSANYSSSGGDVVMFTRLLNDPDLEFKNSFPDIFFKPPDPKTFINDKNVYKVAGNQNYSGITIGKKGVNCPKQCKTICVYSSGNIELRTGNQNAC